MGCRECQPCMSQLCLIRTKMWIGLSVSVHIFIQSCCRALSTGHLFCDWQSNDHKALSKDTFTLLQNSSTPVATPASLWTWANVPIQSAQHEAIPFKQLQPLPALPASAHCVVGFRPHPADMSCPLPHTQAFATPHSSSCCCHAHLATGSKLSAPQLRC